MLNELKPQEACDILNQVIKLDPVCANAIFSYREKCNEKIANHPTIQINQDELGETKVGFIGLLNGMFGVREDGMGTICIEVDDDDKIVQFKITPEKKIN